MRNNSKDKRDERRRGMQSLNVKNGKERGFQNGFINESVRAERQRSRLQTLVLELALFTEDATAHFEDGFETFTATLGILAEALHACLLDLVLDLLPATAERGDLGFLQELRRRVGCVRRWLVYDGLADVEDVGPGQVGRAHGDLLGLGVDVGDLVDVRDGVAAKERRDPRRDGLVASDQAFSSQLKQGRGC